MFVEHLETEIYFRNFLCDLVDDALASLDAKVVGKWRKYFQLKGDFYLAYVSIHSVVFVSILSW